MIAFIYSVSVILAFLLGYVLPKGAKTIKKRRKNEELISLKEIKNFLSYDGNAQE